MIAFIKLYLSLAWRNIWRNKRRTFITMASIVFAVVLAVLLNSVKEGVLYKMQENVVTFYTGAIQIHHPGYWDEKTLENTFVPTDNLKNKMLSHSGVEDLTTRLESFALAASEDYTKGCMVVGINPEKEPQITSLDEKLLEGKYLEAQDEMVMLTSGLAEYLRLGVGDTLVLLGQGYHGISAAGKYPVKGLIKLGSPELNKQVVYLPIQLSQFLFGAENRSTAMVLKLKNIDKATSIAQELAEANPDYEIMDWKTLLPELNQFLEGERAENVIFLFVLYLLISFGIFGTILMMLMERQFEFGVLVAIGLQRIKLSGIVLMENIFISVLGALTGTLLSIPAVLYFYNFPITVGGKLKEAYENFGFEPIFYFSVEPKIFYSQTLVVLIIALVLSFYPLIRLLWLDPIKAMRN